MNIQISDQHYIALETVIKAFRTLNVFPRFQVAGGLAARCYGAKRPLNDLDINIEKSDIIYTVKVLEAVDICTVKYSPSQYQDKEWKLFMSTLVIGGVEVDLCDVNDQYCYSDGKWNKIEDSRSEDIKIVVSNSKQEGIDTYVMSPINLINYKKYLRWPKHRIDENATKLYLENLTEQIGIN